MIWGWVLRRVGVSAEGCGRMARILSGARVPRILRYRGSRRGDADDERVSC